MTIVNQVVREEAGDKEGEISVVFLPDEAIQGINRSFLKHDYPTDVIAFNLEDNPGEVLDGEVYIGFEQARMHAKEYGVSYREEIHRLIIHGVLHLCGWEDDTPPKKRKMAVRENYFLTKVLN